MGHALERLQQALHGTCSRVHSAERGEDEGGSWRWPCTAARHPFVQPSHTTPSSIPISSTPPPLTLTGIHRILGSTPPIHHAPVPLHNSLVIAAIERNRNTYPGLL
jgi:hypothetical protein